MAGELVEHPDLLKVRVDDVEVDVQVFVNQNVAKPGEPREPWDKSRRKHLLLTQDLEHLVVCARRREFERRDEVSTDV